ncbi:MAG: PAC2 family protein [archaeon]|nr:PAC2 family protein [archaeon]
MSAPKYFWYEQKELKDPIAVIGFPSIGLVGSIATSFLARELKLQVVGGITYPDIQQYTILQNGNAYPPIRIYAGPIPRMRKKSKSAEGEVKEESAQETVEEKPKKRVKSRDIIIVTSEVAPKPEFTYDLALDIMEQVKEMGANDIIFLDGIASNEPAVQIMGAYSNDAAKAKLEDAGVRLMEEGIIRGMSGVGLYQSRYDGTNTICLISPANPQLPDPRAAAEILNPLKQLIPRLNVDPTPLYHEAEDLDNRVRVQQNQQNMINQNLYG